MTGIDPYAATNAFARTTQMLAAQRAAQQDEDLRALQIQRAQGINALARNPSATPEDYIRAGDVNVGNALATNQDRQSADREQAAGQIRQIASDAYRVAKANGVAASRDYTRQALEQYGPHFQALGIDVNSGLAKLQGGSDDEYMASLTRFVQAQPPPQPEVPKIGAVQPGDYTPESLGKFQQSGKAGDLVRYASPSKAAAAAGKTQQAQSPEQLLTPGAIDLAAQNYLTSGKLPTGLGRSASAINAKVLGRAAQMSAENGDDAHAAILNRYAFQAQQKAQADTLKHFTSGKEGNTVRSLNVAVQHLDQLTGLADALDNGNVQLINKLGNAWSKQTGVPAPNTFEAMKKVVTDEISKAIIGGVTGVGDREEAAQTIGSQLSPAQLADVIRNYKGLMAGQLNGLRQQYTEGTGRQDFERFLLPTTKAELEAHDARENSAGALPSSASPRQPAQPKSDAEYNALPPGTQYLAPDGSVRTKGRR